MGSWKSLAHYSTVRLLIGGVAVAAAMLVPQILLTRLGGRLGIGQAPGWVFLTYAASVPTALAAYAGYTRCVERRAAIGLHFGWDVTESALFGATMSGHTEPGLFVTRVSGPSLLSGGAFGVEAPIVALLWALLVTGIFLATAARRGRIQAAHLGAIGESG
jgi:CAAX protease family protein